MRKAVIATQVLSVETLLGVGQGPVATRLALANSIEKGLPVRALYDRGHGFA